MGITWIERDRILAAVSENILQADVALDIGCGIMPQRYMRPLVHICCDPFEQYIEHLTSKVEVDRDRHYIVLKAGWEEVVEKLPAASVDSVFLMDVIEHLEKAEGLRLLKATERIARRQVVLFTPIGLMPQEHPDGKDAWGLDGGAWQEHKSGWTPEEFDDSWELYACKNFHEHDNLGRLLEQPFGAFWAVKNIEPAGSGAVASSRERFERITRDLPAILASFGHRVDRSDIGGWFLSLSAEIVERHARQQAEHGALQRAHELHLAEHQRLRTQLEGQLAGLEWERQALRERLESLERSKPFVVARKLENHPLLLKLVQLSYGTHARAHRLLARVNVAWGGAAWHGERSRAGARFNPKVSIVIPVYNGSRYLREAIDSALAQTYQNIEVIVVNDGSDDGGKTDEIARSYAGRIRYFSKENGGVASALNRGVREMTGDYFSWLSHDDVYLPHKVQAQVDYLSGLDDREVVLYADHEVIDRDSRVIGRCTYPHCEPQQFPYEILFHSIVHGCTTLVPRGCFAAVGLFDETLKTTQDYQLWVRMAKRFPFVHMREVLIQSRQHAEQGSLTSGHVDDIDEFYVWCLRQVPSDAIQRICGLAASQFYRKAAQGYDARNLRRAADTARQLAAEHERPAGQGMAPAAEPEAESSTAEATATAVQAKFTNIYEKNVWMSEESRSGVGSSLEQTKIIRREIPKLLRDLGIKRLMDAPCGDFNWLKEVGLGIEHYTGIDIVQEVIRRGNERHGSTSREFLCRNLITDELPSADLILCRDCLVHLSFAHAIGVLRNFKKSGATYLLATTFTDRQENEEGLDTESEFFWRPLNLQKPPFSFPEPLRVINEGCTEDHGNFGDKSLGLWRFADLPL